jgi:hypothetical protein
VLWIGAFLGTSAGAQSAQRRAATREELKTALAATEEAAKQSSGRTQEKLRRDASAIKFRLEMGDLLPGHRIALRVPSADSVLSDTFTVRGDQSIRLPDIPDIPLRGVLDSELEGMLKTTLARYLKEPDLTASTLVRVQLSGGIGRAGFHMVPLETPITDVIMLGGGPSGTVNLRESVVRRGTEVLIDADAFGTMLQGGVTVGDMALRDGDEIVVPLPATGVSWFATRVAPVLAIVGPLIWILGGRSGGRRR